MKPIPIVPRPAQRAVKPDDLLSTARDALTRRSLDEAAAQYELLAGKNKRLEDIITDLEDAVRVHPANRRLYEALGTAYQNKGNMPAALEAFRKALSSIG